MSFCFCGYGFQNLGDIAAYGFRVEDFLAVVEEENIRVGAGWEKLFLGTVALAQASFQQVPFYGAFEIALGHGYHYPVAFPVLSEQPAVFQVFTHSPVPLVHKDIHGIFAGNDFAFRKTVVHCIPLGSPEGSGTL